MVIVIQTPTQSFLDCSSNVLVNGEKVKPCEGMRGWYYVEGKVERLEEEYNLGKELVGWKLKEEYLDFSSSKFPLTFPKDTCFKERSDYDEDMIYENEDLSKLAPFYGALYGPERKMTRPLDYKIYDASKPPIHLPYPVSVQFPSFFSTISELWYTCPCYIKYENVFDILHDRISKIVQESNGNLKIDGYKNIQTLTVSQKISIPSALQVDRTETYYKSFNSKKPSTRRVKDTVRWAKVLEVVGKYDNKGSAIQVESVKGEDYESLNDNLEKYLEGFTSIFEPKALCVCEACKGVGVVRRE